MLMKLTKLQFSVHILGKYSISNFKKIRPEVAELYHTDRRTDTHDEPNCLFRNFGNAPKNWTYCILYSPLWLNLLWDQPSILPNSLVNWDYFVRVKVARAWSWFITN